MKNKQNSLNESDLSSDRSMLIKPTKKMNKMMYVLILLLVVVSGLVFANQETKTTQSPGTKPLSAAQRDAEKKKWEASPDGVKFKEWETSTAGKNVQASAAKIREDIGAFTTMEAEITALSLPPGSRLGFGVMAKINGADYIVNFEAEKSQLEQLHSLKVNDKIMIKSRHLSYAPKYSYPIVSAEYVERDGKIIFKRLPRKGGC
ncbi:hypothetical protein SAMN05421827_107144 [Pedobacter terrae]|uniref:Uncharacterized protein n=1 Tax=Pedobacter terrae TaxID=405671 RepID=A0A1G7UW03_9SPHI|nr:hypothetical protein [Pedobacter terrae]SDG51677.1 hypothetical protein SAMN05421827_107144 [Pedobacter terrae]